MKNAVKALKKTSAKQEQAMEEMKENLREVVTKQEYLIQEQNASIQDFRNKFLELTSMTREQSEKIELQQEEIQEAKLKVWDMFQDWKHRQSVDAEQQDMPDPLVIAEVKSKMLELQSWIQKQADEMELHRQHIQDQLAKIQETQDKALEDLAINQEQQLLEVAGLAEKYAGEIQQHGNDIEEYRMIIHEQKSKLWELDDRAQEQADEIQQQGSDIEEQRAIIQELTQNNLELKGGADKQEGKTQTLVGDIQTLTSLVTTELKRNCTCNSSSEVQGGGAIFTLWGRKNCSSLFPKLYTGYAGGSHPADTGGAAEYLCMPSDPRWGPNANLPMPFETGNHVRGARYQLPIGLWQGAGTGAVRHQTVPCAVCVGKRHRLSVMIPGREACYRGWTIAYKGYLVSGKIKNPAPSQYICMHQNPQGLRNATLPVTMDSKLMFGVKAKCGSLPCPPYKNAILSCVVCVK